MAILHVKAPNENTYNMTVATSGVTESASFGPGGSWCILPNGLCIQWGHQICSTTTDYTKIYWPISAPHISYLIHSLVAASSVLIPIAFDVNFESCEIRVTMIKSSAATQVNVGFLTIVW